MKTEERPYSPDFSTLSIFTFCSVSSQIRKHGSFDDFMTLFLPPRLETKRTLSVLIELGSRRTPLSSFRLYPSARRSRSDTFQSLIVLSEMEYDIV